MPPVPAVNSGLPAVGTSRQQVQYLWVMLPTHISIFLYFKQKLWYSTVIENSEFLLKLLTYLATLRWFLSLGTDVANTNHCPQIAY